MIRLNDSDWERIRHHFPEENISEGRPGRKPVPSRKILEATLWILNTGRSGTCCRSVIRITKRCIAGFRLGVRARFCAESGLTSPTNFARVACWTKKRALSTRPLQWRRAVARTSARRNEEKPENHGDCRSSWFAALGQYACSEPSRSTLGSIVLRFLHDRSQARKSDWRSRLRQRSVR